MSGSLSELCLISKEACEILSELITPLYLTLNSSTLKEKKDKSIFTIADGLVQYLLIEFYSNKVLNIVGEEDESMINITIEPYSVDDLLIPQEFYSIINNVKERIHELKERIHSGAYHELTVFIDPIDGTREFSTGYFN